MIWATVIKKLFGKFTFNFWSSLLQKSFSYITEEGENTITGAATLVMFHVAISILTSSAVLQDVKCTECPHGAMSP